MTASPETFTSSGKPIGLDVYMPAGAAKVPAVLVLHGSAGLLAQYGTDIEGFADALAASGIGAALPHYLEATKHDPALPSDLDQLQKVIADNHHAWRQTCADALAAMAGDARFDSTRLGVMGFSLGGYLALSLALAPPAGAPIQGVVDFFGPTSMLGTDLSSLPRAQIFHGDEDDTVDIEHSDALEAGLIAAGRKKGVDYFYDKYPGQNHGFTEPDLTKSRDRTVAFFEDVLKVGP